MGSIYLGEPHLRHEGFERRPFKPGPEKAAKLRAMFDERERVWGVFKAFAAKHDRTSWYSSRNNEDNEELIGLPYDKGPYTVEREMPCPEGWRYDRKIRCMVADKSEAGRVIRREILALPARPAFGTLIDELWPTDASTEGSPFRGRVIVPKTGVVFIAISAEHVGEQIVVWGSMKPDARWTPVGCRPMQMSSYWRLVEAEARKKKAAPVEG